MFLDDKDLIYEGIATSSLSFILKSLITDDKDLIYEGIATAALAIKINGIVGRQRPDLRRDCD